jgi:WD40 repeat protein
MAKPKGYCGLLSSPDRATMTTVPMRPRHHASKRCHDHTSQPLVTAATAHRTWPHRYLNGAWFVTTGADGTARVWRRSTGSARGPLRGHDGPVNGCSISPDGTSIATAGADGTGRTWESQTGQIVHIFRGLRAGLRAVARGELGQTASTDRRAILSNRPSVEV